LLDINGTEKILIKDPAGIYALMDQETKNCYKDNISKMSKKTKISEIYIAEKIIELASRYDLEKNTEKIQPLESVSKENIEKNNIKILKKQKSHVGYYIIGERI
jgi:ribosomal protein L20A (L18A)